MLVFVFLAAFLAVFLIGWVIYAFTHPVMAGQGMLIFLCQAAGIIAVLSGVGLWLGQNILASLPSFLFAAALFYFANRLQRRWRRW
jgi:hypothetical protein